MINPFAWSLPWLLGVGVLCTVAAVCMGCNAWRLGSQIRTEYVGHREAILFLSIPSAVAWLVTILIWLQADIVHLAVGEFEVCSGVGCACGLAAFVSLIWVVPFLHGYSPKWAEPFTVVALICCVIGVMDSSKMITLYVFSGWIFPAWLLYHLKEGTRADAANEVVTEVKAKVKIRAGQSVASGAIAQ